MTFEEIKKYLLDNDKYIITAHESPDGDAIGSEVALYHLLKKLNKKVFILNSDPTPHNLLFLTDKAEINTFFHRAICFLYFPINCNYIYSNILRNGSSTDGYNLS